jgi:hypothetical protein
MNEKFVTTGARGFSRITQTPPVTGYEIPAAKGRKNAAHGASRGSGFESEKAQEGRKKVTLAAADEGAFLVLLLFLRFAFHSGKGETIPHPQALLYVAANTGSTVGLHPANFSRRNERATPCI